MVVHPAPGNWTGTLVNALVGRGGRLGLQARVTLTGLGFVHRLDKETSGLLIVAKTDVRAPASECRYRGAARDAAVRRYDLCGHLDDGPPRGRPANRTRDPRDRKAHGNRQYKKAGENGILAARTIRGR